MSARAPEGGLVRRPERAEDEPFRRALFAETVGPMFAGLDAGLRDMLLRQQFHAQDAGYRADHPRARFDIVEADGVPVGRLVTDAAPEAVLVVDLAVTVARRRQGIASRLLRDVAAEAAAAGVPVRLRVAVGNEAARRLYDGLGFAVVAVGEVDLTMQWAAAFPAAERHATG